MYLIEKCVTKKDVKAQYSAHDHHLWRRAWSSNKAYISDSRNAVEEFYEKTTRVKHVPYRLINLNSRTVLASINTSDSNYFKKFQIYAISYDIDNKLPARSIKECSGDAIFGYIAGACVQKNQKVQTVVEEIALQLQSIIRSHNITTRYNSNGESGGAYLITSLTDCVGSNADVGISFDSQSKQIILFVKNKFLSHEVYGNKRSHFTNLIT